MNVASLELCKELYELSGWGKGIGKLDLWGVNSETGNSAVMTQDRLQGFPDQIYPAYSLGYLLRKLPALDAVGYVELTKMKDDYMAVYTINGRAHISEKHRADTPEDAACKLAIGLFKQGVLKHG